MPNPPQEELTGQIASILYADQDSGYTVLRLVVPGHREPVTAVGTLLSASPGENLRLVGEWTRHPRFGRQFKITEAHAQVPVTAEGIEKYLGSGLIKGIGPEMARRIVARFGVEALEVIEKSPARLGEVEGIGPKRIGQIGAAWGEQRDVREVMVFLQSHGVSPAFAARIFRQYGRRAVQVVRDNPYRLAEEVLGIGFLTADRIAERLGVARDSPARLEAGLLHTLHESAEEGHCYLPESELLERAGELLQAPAAPLQDAVSAASRAGRVLVEPLPGDKGGRAVYLPALHAAETGVALNLRRLLDAPAARRKPAAAPWNRIQPRLGFELAPAQRQAVEAALRDKVLVVTGGPGTGKTTIMRSVLAVFQDLGLRTLLAAPTGRAAKRLSEVTGQEARTIHRLLEYSQKEGGFRRGLDNPLACDLLVIDEASMVDVSLMYQLLKAVPDTAALILVGDADQLPSVGPGNVLRDIIGSRRVPVAQLTEIFRQARDSRIVVNAHRIRQGLQPLAAPPEGEAGAQEDFFFIQQEDPERAAALVLQLLTERIPRRFGLDPLRDIQVLTPMHRGAVGVQSLNARLQEALNPDGRPVGHGARELRIGDRVMQMRNDYERDVYNGDVGHVRSLSAELQELVVEFDSRPVRYDFADLDEIALAYAVSVHKAQGCEFPAVVVPVMTQHYVLLQRNLLYTAVTRGRRLVVLVGTRKALAIAVRNDKPLQRFTRLAERLRLTSEG